MSFTRAHELNPQDREACDQVLRLEETIADRVRTATRELTPASVRTLSNEVPSFMASCISSCSDRLPRELQRNLYRLISKSSMKPMSV